MAVHVQDHDGFEIIPDFGSQESLVAIPEAKPGYLEKVCPHLSIN